MVKDAKAAKTGPGGHTGATLQSSATGPIPTTGTSEQSLPGPATTHPKHHSPPPLDTEGSQIRTAALGSQQIRRLGCLRAGSLRSPRRVVVVRQGALYAADEEREERRQHPSTFRVHSPRMLRFGRMIEQTAVSHRVSPACRRSGITFAGSGGRAAGRRGEPASWAPVAESSR